MPMTASAVQGTWFPNAAEGQRGAYNMAAGVADCSFVVSTIQVLRRCCRCQTNCGLSQPFSFCVVRRVHRETLRRPASGYMACLKVASFTFRIPSSLTVAALEIRMLRCCSGAVFPIGFLERRHSCNYRVFLDCNVIREAMYGGLGAMCTRGCCWICASQRSVSVGRRGGKHAEVTCGGTWISETCTEGLIVCICVGAWGKKRCWWRRRALCVS